MINWEGNSTEILLNPKIANDEKEKLRLQLKNVVEAEGQIALLTSGSTGTPKWVILSRKALLTSAISVNSHLCISQDDYWLNPLPTFHVGGLGIHARSYLAGCKVKDFNKKWEVFKFHQMVSVEEITLTSLVPTQVYDLVTNDLYAPPSLRAIVVGGGKLSETLYNKALSLNWKLLPSYGFTECASQVATATINSPKLKVLSHANVKISDEGFILVKSDALLTGYVIEGKFIDPKKEGFFQTEDQGIIEGDILHIKGRNQDFVKISGESVDLLELEKILEEEKLKQHLHVDMALIAYPDERLGHVIHLVATHAKSEVLVQNFNERVLPFQRIKKIHFVSEIPKTSLLKIKRKELLSIINNL